MNPFDLRGPEFLRLFLFLSALTLVAAVWVRWRLRVPGGEAREEAGELEPYEVAYLEGGDQGLAKAALSRLVHEQQVDFDFESRELKRQTVMMGKLDPVAAAVYRAVKPKPWETLEAAAGSCVAVIVPIRRRLQQLGLVVTDGDAAKARAIPLLMMSGVLAFGGIKVAVGLSRERPVANLMAACVAVLLLSLFACGRAIHRSRRGDRVLAQLRDQNAALRYQAEKGSSSHLTGSDVVLACALFTVHDVRLSRLHESLAPPQSNDGGGGSSCGGGCGGGCGGCGS